VTSMLDDWDCVCGFAHLDPLQSPCIDPYEKAGWRLWGLLRRSVVSQWKDLPSLETSVDWLAVLGVLLFLSPLLCISEQTPARVDTADDRPG